MSNSDGDFRWKDGVSLREYVDAKFEAVAHATEQARENMERRLQGMNEFRDTLRDQASRYVTRDECNLSKTKIEDDVDELREFRAALNAKAGQNAVYIAYIISGISLLIALLNLAARWNP